MALSDKNIVITPNIGQTADPKIVFSGADGSTGANNITLTAYPTNSGTLSFDGSAGQLFSITNNLTGTLFSVNDISGIPSIEVIDTGLVRLTQYSGRVLLGTGTDNASDKLQVVGNIGATGSIAATNNIRAGTITVGTGATGATGSITASGAISATSGSITTGATGYVGATGSIGAPTGYFNNLFLNGTALSTSSGATGVAGTNGATGVAGTNGATGTAGSNGTNGATGVAGTNGATGTVNLFTAQLGPQTGATGATGSVQINGSLQVGTGATGATGSITASADATINTLTVGLGRGSLSTNTALGFEALNGNNSGSATNTALGYRALTLNTTGSGNTAVGSQALRTQTGNNNSTAVGHQALESATSDSNVAVGRGAGGSVVGGGSNVLIGNLAGNFGTSLVSGSNNIIIGNIAEPSSSSVSNEVTIGNTSITNTRLRGLVNSSGTLTVGTVTGATGATGVITATNTIISTKSIGASGTQGAFAYGTLNYPDGNIMGSWSSNVDSYNQLLLQNTSNGTSASTNFVVSNDQATNSTWYGELGMNSSTFNTGVGGASGASGAFIQPNMVYVAAQSSDLAIGTFGAKPIHFVVNNGAQDAMTIDSTGNVMIGTTAAIGTTRLSVRAAGDYETGIAIGSNNSANNWARLDFKNTNAASPAILYQDQTGRLSIRTDAAYPITFETNGATERMRITAAGGISFGSSGTAFGTSGQVLTSNGDAPPTWTTVGAGTVTSVGFTGGIISVATATSTPALTVAGTSGGIPYFSSGTTWTSSAALAANALVIGGGAGAAPATTTTGTGVLTALGIAANGSGGFVTDTGTVTLTNKTLTDPIITGTITEDVFTITDAAGFAIDPTNGSIQLITLGASRTPTQANWGAGESITLMVNDGTAFTITWTTLGVVWVGGVAPTLATTGFTVIQLWKVSTTIYGALVGSVA